MTQEQKDLLLKDICARLPYGVNCKIYHKYRYYDMKLSGIFDNEAYFTDNNGSLYIDYENVKPYLLPLSSMTEEQEKEYNSLNCWELGCFPHTEDALDFLIANHFDYRGLIPMGLANDASGKNIY